MSNLVRVYRTNHSGKLEDEVVLNLDHVMKLTQKWNGDADYYLITVEWMDRRDPEHYYSMMGIL